MVPRTLGRDLNAVGQDRCGAGKKTGPDPDSDQQGPGFQRTEEGER